MSKLIPHMFNIIRTDIWRVAMKLRISGMTPMVIAVSHMNFLLPVAPKIVLKTLKLIKFEDLFRQIHFRR